MDYKDIKWIVLFPAMSACGTLNGDKPLEIKRFGTDQAPLGSNPSPIDPGEAVPLAGDAGKTFKGYFYRQSTKDPLNPELSYGIMTLVFEDDDLIVRTAGEEQRYLDLSSEGSDFLFFVGDGEPATRATLEIQEGRNSTERFGFAKGDGFESFFGYGYLANIENLVGEVTYNGYDVWYFDTGDEIVDYFSPNTLVADFERQTISGELVSAKAIDDFNNRFSEIVVQIDALSGTISGSNFQSDDLYVVITDLDNGEIIVSESVGELAGSFIGDGIVGLAGGDLSDASGGSIESFVGNVGGWSPL